MSQDQGYVLDSRSRVGAAHLENLAALLDPSTRARVESLRPDLPGQSCLEVGAGAGTISAWLAEKVGPAGWVVAADLHPPRLDMPRLVPVTVDLTSPHWPTELTEHRYDLIVARMVLVHLPDRERVLARLIELLQPGGVLLVEDWGQPPADPLVAAPSEAAGQVYRCYTQTVRAVFAAGGVDVTWPLRAPVLLRQHGLTGVDTIFFGEIWPGGSPGCRVLTTSLRQLRPRLHAHGLTPAELGQVEQMLADPHTLLHSHPLYSTAGHQPT